MEFKNATPQKMIYWMSKLSGFGAVRIRRIYEACDTFGMLCGIGGTELAKRGLISRKSGLIWDNETDKREVCFQEYDQLNKKGIKFITPLDDEYPLRLRTLPDYPMGLYVKGRLPKDGRPSAAVIGARACTGLGHREAETIASVLADAGIQIISGLAAGIDGAGHYGALRVGKDTYGVLGCGVNICYPIENFPLYEQMIRTGGIISEHALDEKPQRHHFPMRNRIISALSDIIIVVEARERSGSLITAELALEQGKEIFAVPGRMGDVVSKGCNQLIRQGANLLFSPYDIIEYFGLCNTKLLRDPEFLKNPLAKKEKMVYSFLDLQPNHFDKIMEENHLTVGECMDILLGLEMKGYIIRTASNYYEKVQ